MGISLKNKMTGSLCAAKYGAFYYEGTFEGRGDVEIVQAEI